jgi:mitochondrial import receptor subunit TOM40
MGTSQSRDGSAVHGGTPCASLPFRRVPLSTLLLPSTLSAVATTACEDPPPPPPPLPVDSGSSTTGKSSTQSPSSSSAPPPPPASGEEAKSDDIASAAQAASAYVNPGPFEQAIGEGKRFFMLDTFDGFRCDINKQASPFMLVLHNFWLGTSMLPDGRTSTYSFVTQVADEAGFMMARWDPGQASVNGRVHRALLGGLAMGKLQIGVSAEGQNDTLLGEVDFGGHSWMGNLRYGSMGGGVVLGCNYMQALTPALHMGGDGMYVGANGSFQTNYALKYTMPALTGEEDLPTTTPAKPATGMETAGSSTLCVQFKPGQGMASLDYKRVVTPNRVTLASSLEFSPLSLESQLLVAAEFKLSRSTLNLCVDGSGHLQSVLEAKLGMGQGSPTINFSADMDHAKQQMRFGYGIKIEG